MQLATNVLLLSVGVAAFQPGIPKIPVLSVRGSLIGVQDGTVSSSQLTLRGGATPAKKNTVVMKAEKKGAVAWTWANIASWVGLWVTWTWRFAGGDSAMLLSGYAIGERAAFQSSFQ